MFLSEWRVPDPCDSKFGIRRQGGFVADIFFLFKLIVVVKLIVNRSVCIYK